MNEPEFRKDYFKNEYVIIAPNRAKRPFKLEKVADSGPSGAASCFFCPERLKDETITYQNNNPNGDWEIISVINKYAAVSTGYKKAFGQAEVIIETRRHGLDINEFSVDHIIRIFDAYANRYGSLKSIEGIKHVLIFKNEGGKAGASIAHTHSQIIALPILPPKVENEARAYNKYRLENNTCPYCDIILNEIRSERVIWEDENLFVLAPYASESPYGAWLIPKRHVTSILDLSHHEKKSFAVALKMLLGKLDDLGISYNYFIENAVNNEDYHMHIKLAPRPNVWAGLELGTGVIVNPVSPEYAASIYRENIKV